MRAARFDERVDANVATASTNVPPAVASEAIVAASAMRGPASGGRERVELADVVAQDLAPAVVVERLELGRVIERARHPFDVRPVGPEDHAVDAHVLDDFVHVVFPERVDPDVAPER